MTNLVLVDCDSKKVCDLRNILEGLCDTISVIHMNNAAGVDWDHVDGLVISGGPHLFTDVEKGAELRATFNFLKTLELPVLGICLGHQAIGICHGASVYKGPENRKPVSIKIEKHHSIFDGIPSGTQFGEDHCEGITLPENFELLASSMDYPVEAMVSKTRPIIGVQFHPEISGEPGRILLGNFVNFATSCSR